MSAVDRVLEEKRKLKEIATASENHDQDAEMHKKKKKRRGKKSKKDTGEVAATDSKQETAEDHGEKEEVEIQYYGNTNQVFFGFVTAETKAYFKKIEEKSYKQKY